MTSTPLDGRLARSQRTRAAVIDALVALCVEGDPSPTALRVAERAGVALRTVYGHFADHVGYQKAFLIPAACYVYIAIYGFATTRRQIHTDPLANLRIDAA